MAFCCAKRVVIELEDPHRPHNFMVMMRKDDSQRIIQHVK